MVAVMVGGTIDSVMVIDSNRVASPAMLEAFTVKLNTPACVGVPKIMPFSDRLIPSGRLPLMMSHVIGVVPEAMRKVMGYAILTAPSGRIGVMMVGGIADSAIVIDSDRVSSPAVLAAFTVKSNSPACVGVPNTMPFSDRLSPGGRSPSVMLHVIGAVPEASRAVTGYAISTMPSGSIVVIIIGATASAVIVTESGWVSLPAALAAFTVKLKTPATVGVPEMIPVAESVKPVGKAPFSNVQVIGEVPVAESCVL